MKLSKKDIRAILKSYDLGHLRAHTRVLEGFVNHNWLITTASGQYVLRGVPDMKTKDEIVAEHKFLLSLQQEPLPCSTPVPIRTTNKDTYVSYKGNYFWVYKYLQGKPASSFTERSVRQVAAVIARLHTAAETLAFKDERLWPKLFDKRSLLLQLKRLERVAKKNRANPVFSFYLERVDSVRSLIRSVKPFHYERLEKLPIHCDIRPQNLLFENDELSSLLDFDNLRLDTAVRDITIFIKEACTRGPRLHLRKVRAFMREYRKHRFIKQEELRYVPDIAMIESAVSFYYLPLVLSIEPRRQVSVRMLRKLYATMEWYSRERERLLKALS